MFHILGLCEIQASGVGLRDLFLGLRVLGLTWTTGGQVDKF